MKKLSIIFLIFISLLLCVSCSGDGKPARQGSIGKYRFKFVMQNAEGSPVHKGVIAFAEKLATLSDGTMTVDINLIPTISSIQDLIEPVIKGEADIVLTGYGYADLSYKVPELEIIGQAYIFKDYDHFLEFRESEYGKKLRTSISKIGIINSTAWYYGVRHTTSVNPINSLADFRGLKLRVPPVDTSIAFAQSMGAIPMPIGFGGFYDALKTRQVVAQENPLSLIESAKIHEVQDYIAMTSHAISIAVPIINKNIYDTFSAEQEAWFNEAIEYGRQVCYNLTMREENYLLEKFEKQYDMKVTYPNVDELRAAMSPYYDELEKQYGKGSVYSIIEMR